MTDIDAAYERLKNQRNEYYLDDLRLTRDCRRFIDDLVIIKNAFFVLQPRLAELEAENERLVRTIEEMGKSGEKKHTRLSRLEADAKSWDKVRRCCAGILVDDPDGMQGHPIE